MKLIDVLNKIAKGEEPRFILDETYHIGKSGLLVDEDDREVEWLIYKEWLNREVEIIEEDKKIEKIPLPSFEEFKNMSAEERYLITAKEYDLLDELIEEIEKLK